MLFFSFPVLGAACYLTMLVAPFGENEWYGLEICVKHVMDVLFSWACQKVFFQMEMTAYIYFVDQLIWTNSPDWLYTKESSCHYLKELGFWGLPTSWCRVPFVTQPQRQSSYAVWLIELLPDIIPDT